MLRAYVRVSLPFCARVPLKGRMRGVFPSDGKPNNKGAGKMMTDVVQPQPKVLSKLMTVFSGAFHSWVLNFLVTRNEKYFFYA